jgi:hypothetical protein
VGAIRLDAPVDRRVERVEVVAHPLDMVELEAKEKPVVLG